MTESNPTVDRSQLFDDLNVKVEHSISVCSMLVCDPDVQEDHSNVLSVLSELLRDAKKTADTLWDTDDCNKGGAS